MQRFVASATKVATGDHAPDRATECRIGRGQRVAYGRRARKGDDEQRVSSDPKFGEAALRVSVMTEVAVVEPASAREISSSCP
jgi:hypothetical protein